MVDDPVSETPPRHGRSWQWWLGVGSLLVSLGAAAGIGGAVFVTREDKDCAAPRATLAEQEATLERVAQAVKDAKNGMEAAQTSATIHPGILGGKPYSGPDYDRRNKAEEEVARTRREMGVVLVSAAATVRSEPSCFTAKQRADAEVWQQFSTEWLR